MNAAMRCTSRGAQALEAERDSCHFQYTQSSTILGSVAKEEHDEESQMPIDSVAHLYRGATAANRELQ